MKYDIYVVYVFLAMNLYLPTFAMNQELLTPQKPSCLSRCFSSVKTVLTHSCRCCKKKTLVELNAHNAAGSTPLIDAIDNQELRKVNALLLRGVNANGADINNITPLQHAVSTGNKDIVQRLVDSKADTHVVDTENKTPLMNAITMQKTSAALTLIHHEQKQNHPKLDQRGPEGITALMLAGSYGNTDVVQALVNAKADAFLKDNNKYTVFEHATDQGNFPVITILAKKGVGLKTHLTQSDYGSSSD